MAGGGDGAFAICIVLLALAWFKLTDHTPLAQVAHTKHRKKHPLINPTHPLSPFHKRESEKAKPSEDTRQTAGGAVTPRAPEHDKALRQLKKKEEECKSLKKSKALVKRELEKVTERLKQQIEENFILEGQCADNDYDFAMKQQGVIDGYKQTIQGLEKAYRTSDKAVAVRDSSLRGLRAELAASREKLVKERESSSIDRQKKVLEEEKAGRLRAELTECEEELRAAYHKAREADKTHKRQLDALHTKNLQQRSENEALEVAVKNAEEGVRRLSDCSKVQQPQQMVSKPGMDVKLSPELAALEEDNTRLRKKLKEVEESLEQSRHKIAAQQKEQDKTDSYAAGKVADLHSRTGELESSRKNCDELEASLTSREETEKSLQTKFEKAEADKQIAEAETQKLQDSYNKAEQDRKDAQDARSKAEERVTDLESQLQQAKEAQSTAEDAQQTAQNDATLAKARSAVVESQATKKVEQAEAAKSAVETEKESLTGQLRQAEQQLDEAKQACGVIKGEKDEIYGWWHEALKERDEAQQGCCNLQEALDRISGQNEDPDIGMSDQQEPEPERRDQDDSGPKTGHSNGIPSQNSQSTTEAAGTGQDRPQMPPIFNFNFGETQQPSSNTDFEFTSHPLGASLSPSTMAPMPSLFVCQFCGGNNDFAPNMDDPSNIFSQDDLLQMNHFYDTPNTGQNNVGDMPLAPQYAAGLNGTTVDPQSLYSTSPYPPGQTPRGASWYQEPTLPPPGPPAGYSHSDSNGAPTGDQSNVPQAPRLAPEPDPATMDPQLLNSPSTYPDSFQPGPILAPGGPPTGYSHSGPIGAPNVYHDPTSGAVSDPGEDGLGDLLRQDFQQM